MALWFETSGSYSPTAAAAAAAGDSSAAAAASSDDDDDDHHYYDDDEGYPLFARSGVIIFRVPKKELKSVEKEYGIRKRKST